MKKNQLLICRVTLYAFAGIGICSSRGGDV